MNDTDRDESKPLQFLLVGLVCVGVALRWIDLDLRGLWWDELYSVVSASTSATLDELWANWLADDSHPPGMLPFLWVWFQVFPATEFWARVPSALAGSAMLIYAAWGTRAVLSLTGRSLLTALLACSYMPVYYAQEARPYAIVMLCSLVLSVQAWRLMQTKGDPQSWVSVVVISVLAAYAHYFGLFLAATWFVVLFVHRIQHGWIDDARRMGFALMGFAVAYLPGLLAFIHLIETGNGAWQKRMEAGDFLNKAFEGYFFNDIKSSAILLAGLAVIALFGRWQWKPGPTRNFGPLVVVLGLATAITALANTQTPVLHVRYFLVFLPPLFLLIAAAISAALNTAPSAIHVLCVALAASGLGVWHADYQDYKKQGWREATTWVQTQRKRSDAIAVLGPDGSQNAGQLLAADRVDDMFWLRNHSYFQYYFDRSTTSGEPPQLQRLPNRKPNSAQLKNVIQAPKKRLILLAGHHLRLNKKLKRYLSKRYSKFQVKKFKSTRVYVFAEPIKRRAASQPPVGP